VRRVEPPPDVARDVYLLCISNVKEAVLKQRLTDIADEIAAAANEYSGKAAGPNFFEIPTHGAVGAVSAEEMGDVYTSHMTKKSSPGRGIYDRLKAAAKFGRCPLCAQGHVRTLDHYLPKSLYPSLAVTPLNLVPACSDCNKAKMSQAPKSAGEQPLHPYFDNFETRSWLRAEVLENAPVAVRFFIDSPADWGQIGAERLAQHFRTYKLNEMYASYAGEELTNIREVIRLLPSATPETVRDYLGVERAKYEARHLNSWQTALYTATSKSDWFCGGGFAAA
jgi:hypothetical protein